MINSAAGINDFFMAAVDAISAAENIDLKLLFETESEDYPLVSLDYYQVAAWSDRRMQFYDAAHLHVKVTRNDDWLAKRILTRLDTLLGNIQNSVFHRALVGEKALDELTKDDLQSGILPVTLPDNVELVTKPGGWLDESTESMRHHSRDLMFFYHN